MEEYLIGAPEAQSLSGMVIEALGGVIWFLAGDGAQVSVLGEVLMDQPMGLFVRAPLSGAVRVGKVDNGAQKLDDPFVVGYLRALVQRERRHPVPERAEEGHSRFPEGGGGPSRQDREQGIARAAFHVGDEDLRVPRPDQLSPFPSPIGSVRTLVLWVA